MCTALSSMLKHIKKVKAFFIIKWIDVENVMNYVKVKKRINFCNTLLFSNDGLCRLYLYFVLICLPNDAIGDNRFVVLIYHASGGFVHSAPDKYRDLCTKLASAKP